MEKTIFYSEFIRIGAFMISSNKAAGQRARTFSLVAIVLTVIATAGRLFSLLFFYDRIGYYQSGALLPIASNILFALSLVFFGVAAIFLLKPKQAIAAPTGAARYVALAPALAAAAHAMISALSLAKESLDVLKAISLLLSVIAAVFFASIALSERPSLLTALSGVGCIAWIALEWLSSYRDFTVPMNSPDKLFFHFGCIGAALLIVAELRALFVVSKPRFYYFSLFTAILTLAVSSIPSLIGMACGVFASYSLALEDLFLLSLLVYATVRLCALALAKNSADVQVTDSSPTQSEDGADAED